MTASEQVSAHTSGEPETPPPPADGADDPVRLEELERLRAEVSVLHARLDNRDRRAAAVCSLRRVTAAFLVVLTAFALVASVVGVWAATTVLNTDRWVATVAPLPRDPAITAAVAEYATTQVFEAVDVEQRLRTVLPEQAAFIAGPVTGQLRGVVRSTVSNVLRSERFARIWEELNRRAHQRALAIINGTSTVVTGRADRVDIDLLPLINQVLRELSTELPTLFGRQISLPDLSSGAIPDNLRARVQDALGVTLPQNFARFTVYDSGQLWAAQQAVAAAKRDLVLGVVGTVVLLVLALVVSPQRRRTLLQLGLWLVVAAVTVTALLRVVRNHLLLEVPAGVYRDGVAATLTSVFGLLRTRGTQLLVIGAVLALAMYLIGPGRGPTWLRRMLGSGLRTTGRGAGTAGRTVVTRGPGWVADHRDPLRVGGIVVAAGAALVLSSWTSLLVIALGLAAYELVVTVAARSGGARPRPAVPEADSAVAGVS
ncbi:hypothetical protein Ani05nite_06840 [Amorphoplanes nipponensis]|uniref:Integral membrane protein n=1 Tax=Actinoplanes nipponensis TaxID=135950 RepID=A0A919MRP1_9ACTN|nr:hypothetical protein [Actinoplanes nipponensis]GIE47150.1 hypothetical protein Ani05nite_06840 [Actinoplanes nipponensis]